MSHSLKDISTILKQSADIKIQISQNDELVEKIFHAGKSMIHALDEGHKILWCGNGGSAADAQHLSTELVARLEVNRKALASLALTTDTSYLTAWGNDMDFSKVFSRQIEALGSKGDILMAVSTSGNSKNIIEACKTAESMGLDIITFLGKGGGTLATLNGLHLTIPSNETQRIQESHITIGHILCEMIEDHYVHT